MLSRYSSGTLLFVLLVLLIGCSRQAVEPEFERLKARAENVTIFRDDFGVPHIYAKTDADMADFVVGWFFTIEPKTQVTTIDSYHGYGYGYGGGRYGWGGPGYGSSTTMVDQYNQGTLIIDMRDGKTDKLFWRGSGSARLREKGDPNKAQQRADGAIKAILSKFPPPTKGK